MIASPWVGDFVVTLVINRIGDGAFYLREDKHSADGYYSEYDLQMLP
jgi:hypothetical protein